MLKRHGASCLAFLILAVLATARLWVGTGDVVPGADFGDNIGSLWSFWWAREALARPGASLWETDALFAPLGAGLVLHTGTPLLTAAAAVFSPSSASPALLNNVCIALGIFLNAICTYAAAFHAVRSRRAAFLAGVMFALSPCLVARIEGHLNLLHAWGLPLVVLTVMRMCEAPTMVRSALVGATLGVIAYVDYYYFVFGLVLALLLVLLTVWSFTVRRTPLSRWRRMVALACVVLAIAALILAVAITISGGGQLTLAGHRISLTGTFNLRLGAWMALLLAAALWHRPALRLVRSNDTMPARAMMGACGVALVVTIVVLAPLVVEALESVQSREYVSQRYRWRSAPAGIDVASLALGNPRGAMWGSLARNAYTIAGIDAVESATWLGFAPGALLLLAVAALRRDPLVRAWLAILAVFLVWSLGPFLMIRDVNTGLLLPQSLARYVPVVNNARLPGRAFVVVVLMTSLIAAMAWREKWSAWRYSFFAVLTVLLLDLWPAPIPVLTLERPALDRTLRELPRGVLLELPFGLRDGFGEDGQPNHRALYFQTIHEQPMAGGFVARLAPQTREAYRADPVFGPLLALSAARSGEPASVLGGRGADPPFGGEPADTTLACSVRYLVVDAHTAAPAQRFAQDTFDLELVTTSPPRTLYRVRGLRQFPCRPR